MSGSTKSRFLGVLVVLALVAVGLAGLAAPASAATYVWDAGGGTTTTWSTGTNWSGDPVGVPVFAAGDIFDLSAMDITAPGVSTVDAGATLGIINIGDATTSSNSWTLANSSAAVITLDNISSNSQINQTATSFGDTISAPLALAGSLDITNLAAAKVLTISTGGITSSALSGTQTISNLGSAAGGLAISAAIGDGISGGKIAIIQNATGTLTLSGTNTYDGGTTLTSGTLNINSATALGVGTFTITAGTINSTALFAADQRLTNNNAQIWNGNFTFTGTRNLDLGTGTVSLGSTAGSSRTVTVSANTLTVGGIISDGTATGLTKAGGGTLFLTGANTYTGATVINGGTLSIGSINLVANANPLGQSSAEAANLLLGNGTTLKYTGAAASTDRSFTINGTAATLDASGAGAINFNSTAALAYGTADQARTLTLTGSNPGNNTLAALIANNGTAATSLTKSGIGTWVLSGENTYTGVTRIDQSGIPPNGTQIVQIGTLAVTKLANGGSPSSIGMSGNAATNLLIGNGTVLKYIGGGDFTDRAFTITNSTDGSYNAQSGTLDASGSGAINWTSTAAITYGNTNFTRTLTLTGSSTAANTLKMLIGNNGNAAVSLAKAGQGTWVLNGPVVNTYTGGTSVNGGTLVEDFANLVTPTNLINNGSALTLGGGTLSLLGQNNVASSQSFTVNPTFSSQAGSGISLTGVGTGTMGLTLTNTWTRNAGSTVNVTLGAGGTLSSSPTAVNTLVVGSGNIAFATVGGTDWAKVSGGTVVGFAPGDYTAGFAGTGDSGAGNYSITDGANVTASEAVNTLKINTATAGQSLALGGNTLTLNAGGLLFIGANDYSITGGTLAGSGGTQKDLVVHQFGGGKLTISSALPTTTVLTKTGTGTLILDGANTYTGNTYLGGGGTLVLKNQLAVQRSVLSINNSSLVFDSSVTANAFTFGGLSAPYAGPGYDVALQNNAGSPIALTVGGTTGNGDYFGALSGAGSLIKVGTGTQTLSGLNTYTGGTTVSAGTLACGIARNDWFLGGSPGAVNVTVASGATLRLNRNTITGNLTLNGGTLAYGNGYGDTWNGLITLGATSIMDSGGTGNLTINANISGLGGLTKKNVSGSLTLNGANTYEGPTTINGGTGTSTVTANGASGLGAATGALAVNNPNTGAGSNVILNLSTTAATTKGSLSGTIATPSGGANTATINNGGRLFTVNQTADGAYAGVIAGAGGFTLGSLSTNTLTLSGANTFSGQLTVESGKLAIPTINNVSTAGPLGNNALSVILGKTGGTGTLQYTGATAGSSKPFTMAAGGTGAFQVDAGAAVLTLSGLIDGDGALVKTGAGTLALTGGNTYGGATTVAGGNLLVNNTAGSGTSAGAVTVASATDGSTASLGGTGTISGAVTVSAPAGTGRVNLITGGDIGAMGTLTISGGLSFGAGAIGYFDINSTSDMDYLDVSGDLTAAGGTIIQVSAGLGSGTYPLIGYTGSASDIGNYTLQDLLGGASPAGYSLSYASSKLNLVITGGVKDCLWNGGGGTDVKWSTSANWDQTPAATGDTLAFGTPGTGGATLNNDIVDGSFASLQFAGGAQAFTLNGNRVALTGKGIAKVIILNDSAETQTVNLPIVLGANGTIDAASASGNIVVGGEISGGGFSLTKSGAGTLTLSSNNTYDGGTIIDAGTVVISGAGTLGATTGALTMGGGGLDLGDTSQTVGAVNVTAAAGSGDTIGNGNLTGASYTLSNATGEAVILANLLANGSIGLTKSGAGTATLSGSGNTYTGATTVSEGTLKLGVADAIPHGLGKGDVTVDGTLDLNGLSPTINGLTGAGAVTNSNSAPATLTVGDINSSSSFPGGLQDGAGTVALVKIGAGTLTILGVNTHTGGTVIEAGTLFVNGDAVKLGAPGSMNVTVESGASLRCERGNFSGTLTMNGGTWLENNGFGGSWTGPVILNATSTIQSNYNQTITGNVSGLGGMTKTGGNTLTLNGTNTYSGITVVNAGTLALANVNSVQNSTLDTGTFSTTKQVTFTAAGTNTYNIGGLQGAADLAIGANTISVGANGASTAYSGAISGTGALTKVGGAMLTLTGANTYDGGTIVSDGTLLINNATGSGTGTGTVAVNSGTLGGSGTIAGAVAVNDGAHLAPGDGVGTLTVGTSVAMAANSIYDWEFASSTSTDLVVVTGDLELTSGWTIKPAQAEGIKPLAGSQYDLFTYATASSISLAVVIDYSGVTNWPNAQIGQDTGAKKIYLKFGVLGDTNGDNVVDAADFITLKKNFGAGVGGDQTVGNFDKAGTVDWDDLSILMNNMGAGSGAPATAPEPCSAMLLVFGAAALLRRRGKA